MAQEPSISGSNSVAPSTTPIIHDQLLPIDKVFPIQIGSEVFRISYTLIIDGLTQGQCIELRLSELLYAILHCSLWGKSENPLHRS